MKIRLVGLVALALSLVGANAWAAPITDPNDARNWQGATVGTFAQLFYGSNTLANRQLVVDNQLLDDGLFSPAGYLAGTIVKFNGNAIGSGSATGSCGSSTGVGLGDFSYVIDGCATDAATSAHANGIDNQWLQTNNTIGATIWDLGFQANKAAIFNTIDHGPLPQEAIESTVYLSNDKIIWTQAVTQRVFLEGFVANLNTQWDGFSYVVGTPTAQTFRYASVIWGGPGALIADGDNEINGVMGLNDDLTGTVPEPASLALLAAGLACAGARVRRSERS